MKISDSASFVLTVFVIGVLAGGAGLMSGMWALGVITGGIRISVGFP